MRVINNLNSILQTLICFSVIFLVTACDNKTKINLHEPNLDRTKHPLIIAPMVAGLSYIGRCNKSFSPTEKNTIIYNICADNNFDLSRSLINKLSSFEPGGAKGKVQIGYTYGISLFSLFKKMSTGWEIDTQKIGAIFITIKKVNRPVILYLMMNHFDTYNNITKSLVKDQQNLMLTQDNVPPVDRYFQTSIFPFTLLTDDSIPVNRYRFNALKAVLNKFKAQPDQIKELVHGITLGGEIHQLFPDFKDGTGKFDNIKITDYSPGSIKEFQNWLKTRYTTIATLNGLLKTHFKNWPDIDAPRKNIRTQILNNFTEHLDSYAHGIVPVFGWLWDKEGSQIKQIKIYIDGKFKDNAERYLNRLDVYQAIEDVSTPNVGFHYNLDFSDIKPGIHELLITVTTEKDEFELSRQEIVFVDNKQAAPEKISFKKITFSSAKDLRNIRYWIDHPKSLQDFYYNPLAKEWFKYREYQVENFITKLWQIASETGVNQNLLYSHQIPTAMNGSWNTVLFATGKTLQKESVYLPGLTLYGGSTNSPAIKSLFPVTDNRLYGVPEFHPQQNKSFRASYDSLIYHYVNNAAFITPYFISFINVETEKDAEHQKFHISPNNQQYGSDHLYNAIIKLGKM